MRYAGRLGLGGLILLMLASVGCGGGSSSSSSSTSPSSTSNVSVTISPSTSTVGYGSTQQFNATVAGSSNGAVSWTVSSASSSSSSQIGSISSSGLYTAPVATSVPASSGAPQSVSVVAGQTVSGVDVTVPALNDSINSVTVTATSQADPSKSASATVTLSGISILALGQCMPSTSNSGSLTCTASSTGTDISRSQSGGQAVYLFVVGYGILPGTTYSISNGGSDVTIPVQPSSAGSNFKTASSGVPAVYFQVVVSPTAALGPRNLIVTNQGNELTSFVGAVDITP